MGNISLLYIVLSSIGYMAPVAWKLYSRYVRPPRTPEEIKARFRSDLRWIIGYTVILGTLGLTLLLFSPDTLFGARTERAAAPVCVPRGTDAGAGWHGIDRGGSVNEFDLVLPASVDVREVGMRDGFCIPLFDVGGRRAALSLAAERVDLSPSERSLLQLVGLHAQTCVHRLLDSDRRRDGAHVHEDAD